MKKFKVIVVDWCVACRSIKTVLPEFEEKYGIKFEYETAFDVDERNVPVIICEVDGKKLGELSLHGYVNANAIDNWLKVFAK